VVFTSRTAKTKTLRGLKGGEPVSVTARQSCWLSGPCAFVRRPGKPRRARNKAAWSGTDRLNVELCRKISFRGMLVSVQRAASLTVVRHGGQDWRRVNSRTTPSKLCVALNGVAPSSFDATTIVVASGPLRLVGTTCDYAAHGINRCVVGALTRLNVSVLRRSDQGPVRVVSRQRRFR